MSRKLNYSEEDVYNITSLGMAIKRCDDNGIPYEHLETLDEIKAELLLWLDEDGDDKSQGTTKTQNVQETIEKLLKRDENFRKHTSRLCSMMEELFNAPKFINFLTDNMEIDDDFLHLPAKKREELKNKEYPIIVAGETSSGKSSFINLLLGLDILPIAHGHCTNTICRIHNSQTKKIVASKMKHNKEITVQTEEELKEKIKPFVAADEENTKSGYKYVDIYWPISFLHENVYIVDSPGIGGDEKLTSRILEYLPQAIGFIYIINSANAGGVQKDRVLRILDENIRVFRKDRSNHLTASKTDADMLLDPSLALFVCNKWDHVKVKDRKELKKNITKTLTGCWPGLIPERQVITFSVEQEQRRTKHGLRNSKESKALINFLESMITSSLDRNVTRHFEWIRDTEKAINDLLAIKLDLSRNTEKEKTKEINDLRVSLDRLSRMAEEIKTNALMDIEMSCIKLAAYILQTLKDRTVVNELCNWYQYECPLDSSDATACICRRIERKMQELVEKSEIFKQFQKRLYSYIQELQEDTDEILSSMEDREVLKFGKYASLNPDDVNAFIASGSAGIGAGVVTGYAVAATVAMPVILPITIGSAVAVKAIGYAYNLYQGIHQQKYETDRIQYMNDRTRHALDQLSRETVYKPIEQTYFEKFPKFIHELCDSMIPNIIQDKRYQMENAELKRDSAIRMMRYCQDLTRAFEKISGQVMLAELLYLSNKAIDQNDIECGEMIGEGKFGQVFEIKLNKKDHLKRTAMKVSRLQLQEDDLVSSLLELRCMLTFHHPNVIEIVGYGFQENQLGILHTEIITELCDCSLEAEITDKPSCSSFCIIKLEDEFESASARFAEISQQICSGLDYLHEKRFVHRHLKLENILSKDSLIKIADAGMVDRKAIQNGPYTAPEVFGQSYSENSTAQDIYSLALILWEMWYGKRAFTDVNPNELLDFILDGRRPNMQEERKPPGELLGIIVKCWDANPTERLSAKNLSETLQKIFPMKEKLHYTK